MKHRYLEVTFRNGKPFAAYLYLPREKGTKVRKTVKMPHGLLVDVDSHGRPLGIEITAPTRVTSKEVNAVLAKVGVERVGRIEWAPLAA